MAFTFVIFGTYVLLTLGVFRGYMFHHGVPQRLREFALAAALTLALLAMVRFCTRSVRLFEDGLRVQGFWNAYKVTWPDVEEVICTNYVPSGGSYAWSRVVLCFRDQGATRHCVVVAANRLDATSEGKAKTIKWGIPRALNGSVRFRSEDPAVPTGGVSEFLWWLRRLGLRRQRPGETLPNR